VVPFTYLKTAYLKTAYLKTAYTRWRELSSPQKKSGESEGQTGSFLMGCREAGIPDFKFHRLSIQWMANQARIAVPPIKYRPGKRNN
jgi:hypothetical protein